MTNNNRFDAALRAHVFHRPFSKVRREAPRQAAPPAEQSTGEPRSADFASELEAALMRDLNSLAAGLRPRKLLPDRASAPAPRSRRRRPATMRNPEPSGSLAAVSAPPSAGPQTAEAPPTMSPYARRRSFPSATCPAQHEVFRPPKQNRQRKVAKPLCTAGQAAGPRRPGGLADGGSGRLRHCGAAVARARPAEPVRAAEVAAPVSRFAPPKRPAYPGAIPRETRPSVALSARMPERPTASAAGAGDAAAGAGNRRRRTWRKRSRQSIGAKRQSDRRAPVGQRG